MPRTLRASFFAVAISVPLVAVSNNQTIAQNVPGSLTQQQFNQYEQSANGGPSEKDLLYLRANRIHVPEGLSQAQLAGLRNVIHDPELKDAANRNKQIAGYLKLAVAQRDRVNAINKLYQVCAFDPRAKGCDKVYQYALSDVGNPVAVTVKATYEGYARYLRNPTGLLTGSDLRFLKANQIVLPAGLRPAQKSGLHNVINDPTLRSDVVARAEAVNGFINYAVEANLYCAFNPCNDATNLPTAK